MAVIYDGIRFSPDEIVAAAQRTAAASDRAFDPVRQPRSARRAKWWPSSKRPGLSDVKVVAGGIIPPEDEAALKEAGVAAVFSPKDYDLNEIMRDIVHLAVD